ncbi:MAG TPA: STAS domain-containing protein [Bryobacteraceae bacterium]|jgi:anti-anti-sigma factor|nr:STAS domain-containing protein [Bryobacteraceae bacterium]
MSLIVNSRVENEFGILELEGSLTLGPTLSRLREAVRQALAETRPRGIVLEASRLITADSAGLGELTVVYTLASRQGCRVALSGAGQNLLTMLEVTHLDELLPAAGDVGSAIALLGK